MAGKSGTALAALVAIASTGNALALWTQLERGQDQRKQIAAGDHSIGSANGFLMADDPRLTTAIHVAGGALDMAGSMNAATTGSGGKRFVDPHSWTRSASSTPGATSR